MNTSAKILVAALMMAGTTVALSAPANAGFGVSMGIGGPGWNGYTRTTVHVGGIGNTICQHLIVAMITFTASGVPTFTMTKASFSATATIGGGGTTAKTIGTGGRTISVGTALAATAIVPTGMVVMTGATGAAVRTGAAASAASPTRVAARRTGTAATIMPARYMGTTMTTAVMVAAIQTGAVTPTGAATELVMATGGAAATTAVTTIANRRARSLANRTRVVREVARPLFAMR